MDKLFKKIKDGGKKQQKKDAKKDLKKDSNIDKTQEEEEDEPAAIIQVEVYLASYLVTRKWKIYPNRSRSQSNASTKLISNSKWRRKTRTKRK